MCSDNKVWFLITQGSINPSFVASSDSLLGPHMLLRGQDHLEM